MKSLPVFLVGLLGLILSTSSMASARSSKGKASVDLGAEVFLVEDKTIAGLDFNVAFNGKLGLHVGFGAIVAEETAPRHNVEENWLGGLLGAHLFYRVPVAPTVEARIGTGVDAWLLGGIASGEAKYAWPVYLEGRLAPTPHAALFVRGRHYLAHSEGLAVGENYNGTAKQAVLLSVGAVYVF